MEKKTDYKELLVEIEPGVTLKLGVSSIDDVKHALAEIKKEGFLSQTSPPGSRRTGGARPAPTEQEKPSNDGPANRVEMRAGLSSGNLLDKNVVAFKDDVPQLLRPNAFSSVSDATLCLLFAVEIGLQTNSISFDNFKDLFEDQNIKSGSPLSMLLNNLKNAGYLDKKKYSSDRTISLTAKGEKKAIEVIKSLVEA